MDNTVLHINVVELSTRMDLLEKAILYFWNCWGNQDNYKFYADCITHSVDANKALPKFYVVLHENEIVASYALLTNDIISRQDLYPWFACLFVNPEHRNKGYATQLLQHGLSQAKQKGFSELYLSSDMEDFYEKQGWTHIANGYGTTDGEIKIYSRITL